MTEPNYASFRTAQRAPTQERDMTDRRGQEPKIRRKGAKAQSKKTGSQRLYETLDGLADTLSFREANGNRLIRLPPISIPLRVSLRLRAFASSLSPFQTVSRSVEQAMPSRFFPQSGHKADQHTGGDRYADCGPWIAVYVFVGNGGGFPCPFEHRLRRVRQSGLCAL